jgi:hypothetical protein
MLVIAREKIMYEIYIQVLTISIRNKILNNTLPTARTTVKKDLDQDL